MKVLVTGSDGFVGRHMVRALRFRGDEVIEADLRSGEDLSDEMVVRLLFLVETPDAIVHLASRCSTAGSISDPLDTFRNTVVTGVNILEAARIHGIPVILTSSVKARDGLTPYGASKRMVEAWAYEYRRAYGLPVVINRPGTIYGPGQEGSPESGWIAWFCKARDEGIEVVVNGDGEQVRDLLHVGDYVRLMLQQLDDVARYDVGTAWDVGGGLANAVTVNEIVEYLGLRHVHGKPRYGDAERYVGENSVMLGWEPTVRWRESETLGPRRHG